MMHLIVLLLLLPFLVSGQSVDLGDPGFIARLNRPSTEASSPIPELLWLKMNEGISTVVGDSSMVGTNTATTDADWVVNGDGFATDYNGSTDNTSTDGPVVMGVNSISISLWLNPDVTNATDFVCSDVTKFNIQILPPNLVVEYSGATGTRRERTTGEMVIGEFHHFVFLLDGSTGAGDIKIYKDGSELTLTTLTATRTGTSNLPDEIIHMGASPAGSFNMDGKIDDFRIYNRLISEAEITQIFNDQQ